MKKILTLAFFLTMAVLVADETTDKQYQIKLWQEQEVDKERQDSLQKQRTWDQQRIRDQQIRRQQQQEDQRRRDRR